MADLTPIFPLNTVLFPGGPLSLRIFEPRYLDMVSDCMRNDKVFGVCLIKSGNEAGGRAETFDLGTLAKIVDWSQLSDGLLGITGLGQSRFRLLHTTYRPDELCLGEIETMPDEHAEVVPDALKHLASLLAQVVDNSQAHFHHTTPDYDSASWVSYRLSEVLPLPPTTKQSFLELEDPVIRLEQLDKIITDLQDNRKT